jgi:hypothetical protein
MIRYQCPSCQKTQETAIMVQDLTRGQKTTCLFCGLPLVLILGVYSMEYALKKLIRKKNDDA